MLTFNTEIKVNSTKVYREGSCLSSDTKPVNDPSMMNGSKLMEMDTSKLFLYDATNNQWREWS